jgi:hypothetical protein
MEYARKRSDSLPNQIDALILGRYISYTEAGKMHPETIERLWRLTRV